LQQTSSEEVHFLTENGHFVFWASFWGLMGHIRCSS